jgi:hypothetical protein
MIKEKKDGSVPVTLSDLDMQRIKRRVRETQERLSTSAADLGLTEAEAELLGLTPGPSLTDLSSGQLGHLANHYVDERMDITHFWRVYQQSSSSESRRVMFADARLETLRSVMGDGEFNAAIAEKEAEWTRRFADTEEAERNLAPCRTCGEPRVFASLSYHLDDSICARWRSNCPSPLPASARRVYQGVKSATARRGTRPYALPSRQGSLARQAWAHALSF